MSNRRMRHGFLIISLIFLIFSGCKKETIDDKDDDNTITYSIDLLPSIGVTEQPNTSDSICPITNYVSTDFDINALEVGSQVPDFTLYTTANQEVTLSELLKDRKPVFLMTGSYTCPQFRSNINHLNNLVYDFANAVNCFVVYTVEAHPNIDESPYSGTVWTTTANQNEGILYKQPRTYAHRLTIINEMLTNNTINCDILVDGPCNEFWYGYGEAPNRAYLIDTTGQVVASHGWFDYATMSNSIEIHLSE